MMRRLHPAAVSRPSGGLGPAPDPPGNQRYVDLARRTPLMPSIVTSRATGRQHLTWCAEIPRLRGFSRRPRGLPRMLAPDT